MTKKRVTKSEKQKQKDELKLLFPKAIEFFNDALKDNLRDVKGRKIKATPAQKLDISKIIVDQVVGRPPQQSGSDREADRVPLDTMEIIKTYEGHPEEAAPTNEELFPVDEKTEERSRADWLADMEKQAVEDANTTKNEELTTPAV